MSEYNAFITGNNKTPRLRHFRRT